MGGGEQSPNKFVVEKVLSCTECKAPFTSQKSESKGRCREHPKLWTNVICGTESSINSKGLLRGLSALCSVDSAPFSAVSELTSGRRLCSGLVKACLKTTGYVSAYGRWQETESECDGLVLCDEF